MLHGQMLHIQMLHGLILHGQMLHGQMLEGQIVLGHLSTVKDSSTNLKCPPRYIPRGVGGWGKVEINAISAQHSWNWAKLELGLSLAITFPILLIVSGLFHGCFRCNFRMFQGC